ncbi:MAG TPA: chemotaxis protein CheW [Gemmatimonadaceae bacterium]
MVASATLLFRVGGRLYGCDIRDAQEMVPFRPATRLPGAPSHVMGLINVRGTVVTVLDLGNRLDATRQATDDGTILLVRHRDRLVGVAVDEVVDVRTLDIDASRADEAGGAIVRGVATTEDGAVVVLDLDGLIRQVLLS